MILVFVAFFKIEFQIIIGVKEVNKLLDQIQELSI